MNFFKTNNIILIILLIIVLKNISQAQGMWERLNSPTTNNLSSVHFTDSLYGWAGGASGTIIHTTNGGADWVLQTTGTDNNIIDIFFLNRSVGWAVYWEVSNFPFGTFVLSTSDGGANWIRSSEPEEKIFSQCIIFTDSLNGWMGGKPYPIVKSTNGGETWSEAVIDSSTYSSFPVYDIKFFNSKFGYASGGVFDCCGIMWWTTNGGNYWFVADTPNVGPEPIYQVYLVDSLNVIGVGGDFEWWGFGVATMRTSDGGNLWNFEYIGIAGVAWDIDFRTDNEVWAALGGEQKLIYSFDSGLSWTPVSTPDSSLIFKLSFPDSLHGFGVGFDGAIIKYKPDISSLETVNSNAYEGFVLYQNYPNPFNSSTKISWHSTVSSWQTLKVYDVLGNEIAILVDDYKSAGSYEIEFDASHLAGGVYFYVLLYDNYCSTRKMILIP